MFLANVKNNSVTLSGKELLTLGSSKANYIFLNFSEEWDNLARTIVFRTSTEKIAVKLEDDQEIVPIPWECYSTVGDSIEVGLYGTNSDNDIVLPTIWAEVGKVVDAATVLDSSNPSPTENILGALVDAVAALGVDMEKYSQHPNLSKRDNTAQHPIKAISGLENSLNEKLTRDDYLTTSEVIKLIGGTNNA